MAASLPPLGWSPLAWVAVWPLLAALRNRGAGARLGLGALAGMVWGIGTVFPWLSSAAGTHLAPGAGPLLAIAAAWFYGGAYLCGLAWVYPWLPRPRWLSAPAAWVLAELVRTHALGGAPWALFGHSQHAVLPLAQLAELTGVAGLSFLVLMPSAALAEGGHERRQGLLAWGAAVVLVAGYGLLRMAALEAPPAASAGVRLVALGAHNPAPDPLSAYLAASLSAPAAHLTIWPENAVPGHFQDMPAAAARLAALARERGWLLFGGHRYAGAGASRRYFNAALLLAPTGRVAVYDKSVLVPFVERSPWRFPSLVERPFSPGVRDARPLEAGALRLGVLVCWESVFAEPALGYARRGADVLVNLTSDRDLGAGAAQLLAFSRFRAIETRRWLVRASGVGPTRLIDPAGRVHSGETLEIAPGSGPSPGLYARWGEWLPALSGLLLAAAFLRRGYERWFASRCDHADGANR